MQEESKGENFDSDGSGLIGLVMLVLGIAIVAVCAVIGA